MDDGSFANATARPDGATDDVPTAAWLTGDDPLGRPPDRQVLVVGDGLAGLALTTFLESAGFDPVLVGSDTTEPSSAVLWPPTLRLLAAVGLAGRVDNVGKRVTEFRVVDPTTASDPTTLSSDAPRTAVVAATDDLHRLFRGRLSDSAVQRDRSVGTVSQRDGAVVVEFGDGVREWFDVVVAADTTVQRNGAGSIPVASVPQGELELGDELTPRRRLLDVWYRDALVQQFPSPEGPGSRLRVTTTEPVPDEWLSGDWTGLPDWVPNPGAGRETKWRRVPQFLDADAIAPDWWGNGHVPRCGPAGLPVAPASGFRAALSVEDAWALTSVLVNGPASASDAVDTYTYRRSRRLSSVVGSPPGSWGDEGGRRRPAALRAIRRLRRAALQSIDSQPTGKGDAFERE